MDGVINVLKPPGMTSHDVVASVRRMTGEKRCGHAGTLDPTAAGVLPLFLGKAVRLSEFVMDKSKSYRAEIVLGLVTESFDLASRPVAVNDASNLTCEEITDSFGGFTGCIEQQVPGFSAVQVDGQRLYHLARQGQHIPVIKRPVSIYSLVVRDVLTGKHPRVLFDVSCSRGTFIRTLCHDLGEKLGVGGTLSFLIRTSSGPFFLEDARTLDEIKADTSGSIMPMERALSDSPYAVLNEKASRVICNGIKPEPGDYILVPQAAPGQIIRINSPEGRFLAVGEMQAAAVHIRKVLCQ